MNIVILTGRLTKDPEVRYTTSQMAVCNLLIAVDRPVKPGAEKQSDFPRVIAFGKTAENCGNYLAKGSMIAVHGYLQTGSYQNKNGDTVYTTDVVANRIEFLEKAKKKPAPDPQQESFAEIDEPIPF